VAGLKKQKVNDSKNDADNAVIKDSDFNFFTI